MARTAVLRQPTLSAKWARVLSGPGFRPGLLSSAVPGSVWKPIGTPGGVELNGMFLPWILGGIQGRKLYSPVRKEARRVVNTCIHKAWAWIKLYCISPVSKTRRKRYETAKKCIYFDAVGVTCCCA